MCDTFVRLGPGGALFAKNSDRPAHEPQVTTWYPPRPAAADGLRTQYLRIADAPAYGVLVSQPTWLWGAEHGVNEHGVAIGNERVWARRSLDGADALIGMDLVRLGLERGGTADEALDVITSLLETHGQGGSGNRERRDPYDSSFLIVDGRGGWILETFGREWVAGPVDSAAAISNRYVLDTHWTRSSAGVEQEHSTKSWHDPAVDTSGADHRLAATRACIAQADVGPVDAMAALRDHGTGPWGGIEPGDDPVPPPTEIGDDHSGITVCLHQPEAMATTASMVAELPAEPGATVRAWVCIGAPCVGSYELVTLPGGPPDQATRAT